MHIGQYGYVQLAANFAQNFQARIQSQTSLRVARGTVGFVKRAFINERDAKRHANVFELTGNFYRHLQTLNRASASNQEKRLV